MCLLGIVLYVWRYCSELYITSQPYLVSPYFALGVAFTRIRLYTIFTMETASQRRSRMSQQKSLPLIEKVSDMLVDHDFESVLTALIAYMDGWIADDLTGPLPPDVLD